MVTPRRREKTDGSFELKGRSKGVFFKLRFENPKSGLKNKFLRQNDPCMQFYIDKIFKEFI